MKHSVNELYKINGAKFYTEDYIKANNIRENYKGYDLMAIDNCDFYWEEFMGSWSAVGEYGWSANDADIERAGIDHVSVDEGDKIVYIHINDQP